MSSLPFPSKHEGNTENVTPTIFTISSSSIGLSFSIVGFDKKWTQRTAQLSATVYATSLREESLFETVRLFPSLRGDGLAVYAKRFVVRPQVVIANSYQLSALFDFSVARDAPCNTPTHVPIHALRSTFDVRTRTTRERNRLKKSLLVVVTGVYSKCWETLRNLDERNQRTVRSLFMNNKKVGEESTGEQFCVYELFD